MKRPNEVKNLFGDESALMDRIMALRASLAKSQQALATDEAARKAMADFDAKVDTVRKLIVATTEGGAITGEERLREHTDQLYGAILSYEGKPADYQIARIDSLRRELEDATKEFEGLLSNELPKLNEQLKKNGQPAIEPPPAKVAVDELLLQPQRQGPAERCDRSRFAHRHDDTAGKVMDSIPASKPPGLNRPT